MWFGTNSFNFDKFTSFNNDSYGHRNFKTYRLNEGMEINGDPIEAKLLAAFAPENDKDKEFVRIRINSENKPVEINFYYQKDGVTLYTISQVANGPMYLKNYRGYEAAIGRTLSSVNSSRPRIQGRLLIAEILHNLAEDFVITDITIEYKKII